MRRWNFKFISGNGLLLTALLLGLRLPLKAQSSSPLTKEERYHRYLDIYSLVRINRSQPIWLSDGNRILYQQNDARKSVYLIDPKGNTKKDVTGADFLLKTLKAGATLPGQSSSDPGAKVYAPGQNRFAYTQDSAVYVAQGKSGGAGIKITGRGNADLVWQVPEGAWSPDGQRLVLLRDDTRAVFHLPVTGYNAINEQVASSVYARSGQPIAQTGLFIWQAKTRALMEIKIDGRDHYLFPVGWRKTGTEFILMRLDRACKKLELLAADGATGKCRTILTEMRKTFVAGMDFIIGGWMQQCTLLDDGQRFIWMSERDGWNHLYLYDLEGRLIRQLTRGAYPVIRVAKADLQGGWLYYLANAEKDRYYTHLYRVDFNGGHFKKLTDGAGRHSVSFSPSTNYFIDRFSSSSVPPVVQLRSAAGKLLRLLDTADTQALRKTGWTAPERFIAKASDGVTDVYGILYKPFDFDPAKKYPVVEFIYAGPIDPMVPTGFLPDTDLSVAAEALAQLGYITVMVDSRGTTGRSKAFQDAVYGNIGRYEIPDHKAAIKEAAMTRPYMDLSRVGIFGHSWGGYFAVRALLTAPDFYKVGIASAPGDLYQAAEVNEPYMGLPEDNPEGYRYGSNEAIAGQLKGKLLFIHGTSDVNAPLSTTIRMVDALIKAGKPYDLLLLPAEGHFFNQGKNGRYVADRIARYFKENL